MCPPEHPEVGSTLPETGTHRRNPGNTPEGTWGDRENIQRAFQVSPECTLLNLIFVQGPKLILIIKPQRRKSEGKGHPRDTGRPDSDLSVHNSEYLNNGDSASHSTLLKVWTREISDEPPDPGIPSNHAHSLPHDCSEPVCPLPTNKAGARIRTHWRLIKSFPTGGSPADTNFYVFQLIKWKM